MLCHRERYGSKGTCTKNCSSFLSVHLFLRWEKRRRNGFASTQKADP